MKTGTIFSAWIAASIFCLGCLQVRAKPSFQRNLDVRATVSSKPQEKHGTELGSSREEESSLGKGSAQRSQRVDSPWPKSRHREGKSIKEIEPPSTKLVSKLAKLRVTKSMVKIKKTKTNMFPNAEKPEQHGKLRRENSKQQTKLFREDSNELIEEMATHNHLASEESQQSRLGGNRKHGYRLQKPPRDDKTAHGTTPTLQKRLQSSPILPKATPLEHKPLTRIREVSGAAMSEHNVRAPGFNSSVAGTGGAAVMPKAWSTASCCGREGGSRIVGGVELSPAHKYPWQAALSIRGRARCSPFCGASVINDLYVLTAAHCTDGQNAGYLEVCIGMHSSSDPDVLRAPVAAIVQHAGYDSNTIDKDIALLRLSERVQWGPTVAPVCLPDATDGEFTGVPATVSGWGTLHFGGPQPQELMTVDLHTVSNCHCQSKYGYGTITDYMLCAYAEGKDSCQGDSGGPLTTLVGGRSTQIGVVSFGKGCAEAGFPGVYARVTKLRQWINQNTLDGRGC